MSIARRAGLAVTVFVFVHCRQTAPPEVDAGLDRVAAAAQDRGDLCLDVADVRACWGAGECARGCVVSRALPAGPSPPSGWRCAGMGNARVCEARSRNAGRFECANGACTQRLPRLPDDGEWECAEMDGAVLCHGGGAAAGEVPGPPDRGWVCGARRNAPAERVCVDLSPDPPGETREGWRCAFTYEGGSGVRTCAGASGCARAGAPCGCGCPSGTLCVADRCLPGRPAPDCWFDADCEGGHCRFGTCVKDGTP